MLPLSFLPPQDISCRRATISLARCLSKPRPEPVDERPPRARSRKPDAAPRCARPETLRAEGKADRGVEPDRARPERPEHRRPAQAGADLQDPPVAGREGRPDLRRRRPRGPARRLWLPSSAGLQLPAGSRRHLRLAVPDPALRTAHRRYHLGPGAAAEGHGTILRAPEGRGDQL